MTTARTYWKKRRWSILVETRMTSSDSGVVSRQSGGSATIRLFSDWGVSPCQQARSPADQPEVASQSLLLVVQEGTDRAHVKHAEPGP